VANISGKAGWHPEREVEIVAGTPPGGGLDRTARALAAAIEAERLLDVPVRVVNIAGDGARKAWRYVEQRAGDAHVLAISSPNLTTDRLVGLAGFDHSSFTPLAILYNEYIAFIVPVDSPLRAAYDLVQLLATRSSRVTVALSTALGNPNHIALANVIRHAGGDVTAPRIRVFDSALDALADALTGNADTAVITAASAVRALAAGTARALAVSAPQRLAGMYASVPTWVENGVDCTVGAWRGVTAASGLAPEEISYWERILRAAAESAAWTDALARQYWTGMYVDGDRLRHALAREAQEMATILTRLGLAKL
jgi:putative tricarboxylic transport membrane protein